MSPSLATKTYTYLYMYICTHIYFTSIFICIFDTCIYSASFSYKFHTIWVSTSKEMLLLVSPLLFEWRKYKTFHWCLYRARIKDPTVQNILFAKLFIPSQSTNVGRMETDSVQPWGEGLGDLDWWESKLNPPMRICNPKTLGCLKSSAASRGCGSTPVLLPHKTPPEVLCSGVGSPVQQICGHAGVSPEEAMRMLRILDLLCYGDGLRQSRLFCLEKRCFQRDLTATSST